MPGTCSPWSLDYAHAGPSRQSLGSIPEPPEHKHSLIEYNTDVSKPKPKPPSSSTDVINPMDDPLGALGFAPKTLRMKRAWDLAISPAKALPMQAFMLYMSGSGVQIFSMGTIFVLLSNPVKAVTTLRKTFQPFEPTTPNLTEPPSSLFGPKLVYILCQCLTLALGLWKCNQMGILPTGSADFLAFETRGEAPEKTYFSALGFSPHR